MRYPRRSTAAVCVAALAVASLGGIGLSQYSQGGTFSFYKQKPNHWPEVTTSQPAPLGSTYPVDAYFEQPAAQPNRIDAVFASETVPVPELPVADYRPEVTDDAPESAEDTAVVRVAHGSWSQPQLGDPQPAAEPVEEAVAAAPAVETAAADTPGT